MKKLLFLFAFLLLISCEKTETEKDYPFIYPENGYYGQNLIFGEKSTFYGDEFSLSVDLKGHSDLKVVLTYISGDIWESSYSTNADRGILSSNKVQIFTPLDIKEWFDVSLKFESNSRFILSVYQDDEIVKVKDITIVFQ